MMGGVILEEKGKDNIRTTLRSLEYTDSSHYATLEYQLEGFSHFLF